MKKLDQISNIYSQAGKGSTHACIIENGSLPHHRKVFCKAEDLQTTATSAGLHNPAIIIIGDVVALAAGDKLSNELLTFNSKKQPTNIS